MSRQTFLQLFKLLDANTLRVLRKIKIGSFEIDEDAEINRGVTFAGIDLFNYINADYEGEEKDGAFVIENIYPHG
jgi:hypothetical protein